MSRTDKHGYYKYCECCGQRYVRQSMVMLLLSVYGRFIQEWMSNGGIVERKPFQDRLREVGPMDNEQISRIFGFLREVGCVSSSADKKYLLWGIGTEVEEEHRRRLLQKKWSGQDVVEVELPEWSVVDSVSIDGDVVITDPYYLAPVVKDGHEWQIFADSVLKGSGISNRTYYGDWGCTVYKIPSCEVGFLTRGKGYKADAEIGKFCADSGQVCVVALDDILAGNPNFEKWVKEHPWCVTIVRGFKGKVSLFERDCKPLWGYEEKELRVFGEGEQDGKPLFFESIQTSG